MSFFEMFSLVASAATIFAFIVGLFAVYNGRMTRKVVTELIERLDARIEEMRKETNRLLVQINEGIEQTRQLVVQTQELITRWREEHERRMEEWREEHEKRMERWREETHQILLAINKRMTEDHEAIMRHLSAE